MLLQKLCPGASRVSQRAETYIIRPTASVPQFQSRSVCITALRNNIRAARKVHLPTRNVRFQSAAIPSPASAGSPLPSQPLEALTWNKFLALRKTRRRMNLTMSILFASTAFASGAYFVAGNDLENRIAQTIGMDPIITMGLVLIGCGGVGWLIGPFFGTALFQYRFRGLKKMIEAKEKEFFTRIKKHRVDPTSGSYQNPVPDYYGEKIGSVSDYRRWLKDQRAFNLKRTKGL